MCKWWRSWFYTFGMLVQGCYSRLLHAATVPEASFTSYCAACRTNVYHAYVTTMCLCLGGSLCFRMVCWCGHGKIDSLCLHRKHQESRTIYIHWGLLYSTQWILCNLFCCIHNCETDIDNSIHIMFIYVHVSRPNEQNWRKACCLVHLLL